MSERSVFGRLRREHRMVLEEIASLERIVSPRTRARRDDRARELKRIVRLLERQFAIHMSAEDRVLFPALVRALPEAEAIIGPLRAEHGELRGILSSLGETLGRPTEDARREQVPVLVRDLVDLLRIHIRKEEAVIFGVAERVLPAREVARLEAWRARRVADSRRSNPRRSKGER